MRLFWPLSLMVVIFMLSSIPGPSQGGQSWLLTDLPVTDLPSVVQNALHVPLYGLLQWFWLRCFTRPGRTLASTVGLAALITVAYGSLDELHQGFVPGRYSSVLDILLNALGVVAGTAYFVVVARRTGHLQAGRWLL